MGRGLPPPLSGGDSGVCPVSPQPHDPQACLKDPALFPAFLSKNCFASGWDV